MPATVNLTPNSAGQDFQISSWIGEVARLLRPWRHVVAPVIALDLEIEDVDALEASGVHVGMIVRVAHADEADAAGRAELVALQHVAPHVGGEGGPLSAPRRSVQPASRVFR